MSSNRGFEYGMLATMGVSGVGLWYLTDSVWLGALGVIAPPILGVIIMLVNDAHTHIQHGSGTSGGRIKLFGADSDR